MQAGLTTICVGAGTRRSYHPAQPRAVRGWRRSVQRAGIHVALWALCGMSAAQEPSICRGEVCLSWIDAADGRRTMVAHNAGLESRTVFVELTNPGTGSLLIAGDPFLLSGGARRPVATIDRQPSADPLRISFTHSRGTLTSRLAPTCYALPIAPGHAYRITQGPGHVTGHAPWERNAYDFSVASGTPVVAARDGLVIEVVDHFDATCTEPAAACRERANVIVVEHADASIAYYVHLQHNSAEVSVGERVEVGQYIANAGNTGYSTGPHLHFDVVGLTDNLARASVPVQFADGTVRAALQSSERNAAPDDCAGSSQNAR